MPREKKLQPNCALKGPTHNFLPTVLAQRPLLSTPIYHTRPATTMANALKQAGNKHFGAKEYAKAVKKYTEALTKNPSDDDAAVILANRSASYTLINKYDLGTLIPLTGRGEG